MQLPPPRVSRCQHAMTWLAGGFVAALVIAVVALGVYPAWGHMLYYHPANDALWRALPAQCVHLNTPHLLMNLAALLGAALIAGYLHSLSRLPGALLTSAVAVGLGLQMETPPLSWYVGMSGALYGVFVWLALEAVRQADSWHLKLTAFIIGVGTGAKALLGIGGGMLLANASVAQGAHLYGYLGGLCFACCTALSAHYQRRSARPQ
ncbi:rhomboid family intramembrane serine protease [Uliginosibacterium gangwonense]|uniref:rhomboid family intramembrane serine protease n=1 Tax=Uliginosibacterium gangwonense TaxID=392736 RepID=UPI00039CB171|nr:rhomboid family intramembrane serine protease [Uliginosibacterium gangwonense]